MKFYISALVCVMKISRMLVWRMYRIEVRDNSWTTVNEKIKLTVAYIYRRIFDNLTADICPVALIHGVTIYHDWR